MTAQQIIQRWNEVADECNQWDSLGDDEKIEFAFGFGREGVTVQADKKLESMETALKRILAIRDCECDEYHGHGCLMCKVRTIARGAFGFGRKNECAGVVTAYEKRLGNLLSRIHRDGGQYISEHGWEKAEADAEAKVVSWIARDDL